MRVTKFNLIHQLKNSLPTFISHMHMNRLMVVAVKKEAKSINLEYLWHLLQSICCLNSVKFFAKPQAAETEARMCEMFKSGPRNRIPRLYPFGKRTIRCRFEAGSIPHLMCIFSTLSSSKMIAADSHSWLGGGLCRFATSGRDKGKIVGFNFKIKPGIFVKQPF